MHKLKTYKAKSWNIKKFSTERVWAKMIQITKVKNNMKNQDL